MIQNDSMTKDKVMMLYYCYLIWYHVHRLVAIVTMVLVVCAVQGTLFALSSADHRAAP